MNDTNDEKLCYGWSDSEQLQYDPDEFVYGYIYCSKGIDLWDDWAARQNWPLRVSVFRCMDPARHSANLAAFVLELLLERLDEEYSDLGGDYTEPNGAMKGAADAFVSAVLAQYKSWVCEPTGKVVEYTREEARRVWETSGGKEGQN